MSNLISTINGKKFYLDEVTDIQVLNTDKAFEGNNRAWFIFWMIMCWPVALFMYLYKYKATYRCRITLGRIVRYYSFDKKNYNLLFAKEGIQ